MQTQLIREGMVRYYAVEKKGEYRECYEEKLFRFQKVPYFMSYEFRELNGEALLYYRLKYATSLKQAFGCIELTLEKTDNMIRSIVGVLESCDEYLLLPENVIYDPESVFINIDSGELIFCYYCDKQEGRTLKELVMEIIQQIDKRYEQGAVKLLKFYNLLTEPNLSLDKLKAFIHNRYYEAESPAEIEKAYDQLSAKENEYNIEADREADNNRSEKKSKGALCVNETHLYGAKHQGREKPKLVIKVMMALTAIVDLILFIGLLFNLLTYEKTGYLFIGMAVLIIEVIIYMHFDKEESADDIMEEYQRETKLKENEEKFEVSEPVYNKVSYDEATILLSKGDEASDCIIEEDNGGKLFLEAMDKDRYEPVHIDSASLVVGSLPGSCGYVLKARGISRLHAKLLEREDGLFLMDMNSTNGSYVNGEILQAGMEYPLEEGDLISFAGVQFYVVKEAS